MTVNSRELYVFLSLIRVEVKHGHSPFTFVLVPIGLEFDLLKLLVAHRNLHHCIGELEVLIQVSNGVKQVLFVELILSL